MCPVFHCRSTRDTLQCGILIRCEVEEAFLDRDLGGGKTARSHGAVRAAAGGNGVDSGLITFTDVVERRAPQSETRYILEARDKPSGLPPLFCRQAISNFPLAGRAPQQTAALSTA